MCIRDRALNVIVNAVVPLSSLMRVIPLFCSVVDIVDRYVNTVPVGFGKHNCLRDNGVDAVETVARISGGLEPDGHGPERHAILPVDDRAFDKDALTLAVLALVRDGHYFSPIP